MLVICTPVRIDAIKTIAAKLVTALGAHIRRL
jgi:hypothetical protein